jgi:exopolysaccharide production protein ExoQ
MPPIVALILFTTFVVFLLRLDNKQYPNASLALWVPVFWFLLASSKPLAVYFGTSSGGVDSGTSIDTIVVILLLFFGMTIIYKRNFQFYESFKNNPALIFLMIFMFISISWSDIPFVAFKRWVRNFFPIVMALIIASEADPYKSLQCLFRRMIYILVPFSYLLVKYYGHIGRQYSNSGELMWTGVSHQKNGLAFLCSFALIYFLWTFIRRWKGFDKPVVWYQIYIELSIILLSFYLLLGPQQSLTYSATALIGLLIAPVIFIAFFWFKKRDIVLRSSTLTILITIIIIYGTITPFIGRLALYDPSVTLGRENTLTGRSTIWANLVPYAYQKPILGHGYGSFWSDSMREFYWFFPAHNGYLDTILDIGFIGLFFLSMFLISSTRKAQKLMTVDIDWGHFGFALL